MGLRAPHCAKGVLANTFGNRAHKGCRPYVSCFYCGPLGGGSVYFCCGVIGTLQERLRGCEANAKQSSQKLLAERDAVQAPTHKPILSEVACRFWGGSSALGMPFLQSLRYASRATSLYTREAIMRGSWPTSRKARCGTNLFR